MGLRKILGKRRRDGGDAGPAQTPAASSVPTSAELGEVLLQMSPGRSKPEPDEKTDVVLPVLSYSNDGSLYSNVFEEKEMKVMR